MTSIDPKLGARNLLINCAHAKAGDRLLIAHEPADLGYYDGKVTGHIAAAGRALGLHVEAIDVGFNPDKPHLTPALMAAFERADVILFLSRLGDQLRFSDMAAGKTIIVSFAVNEELLGSGFGTGHYEAFAKTKRAVNNALAKALDVRVTCLAGTDFRGQPMMNLTASGDTTIKRFPMSVFAPIPAHSFSGRVALCGFLTGTGSRYYDEYHLNFAGRVWALMENGRLTGFDGDPADVAKANAHYDHVSERFGIDRNFVHSWHAGIHPGCGYLWDMNDNVERWGGTAFGNPRILHFHTCGAYAPGEISWNMVDPTIWLDGVAIWDRGKLHLERLAGGPKILADYPDVAALFSDPDRHIGMGEQA